MGKLAERLADAERSGVYRISVTDAVEEAAGINGYVIERIRLETRDVQRVAVEAHQARAQVLVFSAFEGLLRDAPGALQPLLEALASLAEARRAQRAPCFATFLDPSGLLDLPPLYDRRRAETHRAPLAEATNPSHRLTS